MCSTYEWEVVVSSNTQFWISPGSRPSWAEPGDFHPDPGFIPSFLSAQLCDTRLSDKGAHSFSYCSVTPWVSFTLTNFPGENYKVGLFSLVTKSHCVILSSYFLILTFFFWKTFSTISPLSPCSAPFKNKLLNEKIIYWQKFKASFRVTTSIFLGQRRTEVMRNLNF